MIRNLNIISYAQNYEDVILNRIFPSDFKGFYVDVGACHPLYDSVTNHFYINGWTGINIEPVKSSFQELLSARERDINLNFAVGSSNGNLDFFITESSANSTCNKSFGEKYEKDNKLVKSEKTSVYTLDYIWENHVNGQAVDFLKIDVEGFEKEVLLGADFTNVNPKVILLESTIPNSKKENFEEWEFLLKENYTFFYFDGLNRFYHRKDYCVDIPNVTLPPNVFDRFEIYSDYKNKQDIQQLQIENKEITKQLKNADVTLTEMQNGLVIKEKELIHAQDLLVEKEVSLTQAEGSLKDVGNNIGLKEQELTHAQELLAQQEIALREAAGSFKALEDNICRKDKELIHTQEILEIKEVALLEAAGSFKALEDNIGRKDKELIHTQEILAQQEIALREAAGSFEALKDNIGRKDKELIHAQELLAQQEIALKEAAGSFEALEDSIGRKDKELIYTQEILKIKEVELTKNNEYYKDIERVIGIKELHYQVLDAEWKSKDSEISVAYNSLKNSEECKNKELEAAIAYCSKLSEFLESKDDDIKHLISEIEKFKNK